jgi:DNA-binding PadR family transcriptional regulator
MWKLYALDVAILLLLVALPTHPYDLERPLAAFGYVWSKPGTVNQRLKRLRAEGLATSVWETPQHGRARLIYSISADGIAYLRREASNFSLLLLD